jgi:preprotein translocase subunit SecY
MAKVLENAETALGLPTAIVANPGLGFELLSIIVMTTATMLLMWLGEQITERGIGNGISLIITVNIIASMPGAVSSAVRMFRPAVQGGVAQFSIFHMVGLLVMLFLVVAATIAVTQAQRKIPVQYAKRVVGRKVYGGQSTYMPLRVNYSGVMPIIFAQAIMMFPPKLFGMLPFEAAKRFGAAIDVGTNWYLILYGILIFFFSYFWVATQFNPIQIADDLKKYGGYLPGIRPGRPTADFLDRTMTRITFSGALFLTIIAVIPMMMYQSFSIPFIVAQFFGGTSLLIIVGVVLDTMRQVESHLLMRNYDGFLKKGKLRSRK